jgi:hypothetical protein
VDFVVCTLAVKNKSGQVSTCQIGPFPCQSKERLFVLLHSQAIFSHWSQQFPIRKYHRVKTFLTEDVILPELLPDYLSNVLRKFLIIASVTAMIL